MKPQDLQRSKVMPGFVKSALGARELIEAFQDRPEYQQNGYLSWIEKAFIMVAKRKRLDQMLDELEAGNLYLGEPWTPPPPVVRPEPEAEVPEEPAAAARPAAAAKPKPAAAKPAAPKPASTAKAKPKAKTTRRS